MYPMAYVSSGKTLIYDVLLTIYVCLTPLSQLSLEFLNNPKIGKHGTIFGKSEVSINLSQV